MPPSSFAAVSPASPDRREPSLSGSVATAPRLVPSGERSQRPPRAALRSAAMPELHAGERLVVVSAEDERSPGSGPVLRKAGIAALIVLALVGAASLLRGFVGL